MPWTPPPGGAADEHRIGPRDRRRPGVPAQRRPGERTEHVVAADPDVAADEVGVVLGQVRGRHAAHADHQIPETGCEALEDTGDRLGHVHRGAMRNVRVGPQRPTSLRVEAGRDRPGGAAPRAPSATRRDGPRRRPFRPAPSWSGPRPGAVSESAPNVDPAKGFHRTARSRPSPRPARTDTGEGCRRSATAACRRRCATVRSERCRREPRRKAGWSLPRRAPVAPP